MAKFEQVVLTNTENSSKQHDNNVRRQKKAVYLCSL